jgi:uncharacterized membrane protein
MSESPKKTHRKDAITSFRSNFVSGLMVILPAIMTLWVIWFFFNLFGSKLGTFINSLFLRGSLNPLFETFLGFLLAIIVITSIGYIAKTTVTKSIAKRIESYILSIPLISTIYSTVKSIIDSFTNDKSSFKGCGIIEYPRKGIYTLCFITNSAFTAISVPSVKKRDDLMSVFVPTTPNPTSGFFLLIPEKEVEILDITIEDGLKLIISAGVITPES